MAAVNPNILLNFYPRYMYLQIVVEGNPNLYNLYANAIEARNQKMFRDMEHIDAGFDLFVPFQKVCDANRIVNANYAPEGMNTTQAPVCNKFDFGIKCMATVEEREVSYNTGFYLYPRSSVSKGPLRLANSTGIIDSGYRGNIIGMFDSDVQNYVVEQYDRIAQICAPSLMPIYVELADFIDDNTARGGGGFGSTGR